MRRRNKKVGAVFLDDNEKIQEQKIHIIVMIVQTGLVLAD